MTIFVKIHQKSTKITTIMKKIMPIIAAAAIVFSASYGCARDKVITVKEMPQAAQNFLEKYFSEVNVIIVVKDGNEYEVRFGNGWEAEFNREGEWKSIDCKNSPIPQEFAGSLPAKINSYISANFPDCAITEISKDRRKYEVELNDQLDLEFSLDGEFLRLDD